MYTYYYLKRINTAPRICSWWLLPELEEVLEVVPEDWDCSNAGLVDTLLLVLVPSSAVFLKKLCCRA